MITNFFPWVLVVIGVIGISQSQSIGKNFKLSFLQRSNFFETRNILEQQAAVSRTRCEEGLRAKGCTGITSSCDIEPYYYSCKCNAASCPPSSSPGPSNSVRVPPFSIICYFHYYTSFSDSATPRNTNKGLWP